MRFRARFTHQTHPHPLAYHRVILGYLGNAPAAKQMQTAIANVSCGKDPIVDRHRRQSSRHPAQFRHRQREIVNLDIRSLHRAMKPLGRTPFARTLPERLEHDLDRHLTRDLAARVSTDSIGDREDHGYPVLPQNARKSLRCWNDCYRYRRASRARTLR